MKIKKRRKSSRFRGKHTAGRGFKKKARGSGHRGGVGKAGTGKRADQKKNLSVKENRHFGKRKVRRAAPKVEIKTYTLDVIANNMQSFVKKGIAKESAGTYELNLDKYKIIGDKTNLKMKIKALAATKGAIEAVKKAGGEIIVKEKVKKEEVPKKGADDGKDK